MKRYGKWGGVCLAILMLSAVASADVAVEQKAAQGALDMFLTSEEKSWLAAHPIIKVSNEMDWPPFDFAIGDEPQGYSIDLLNLLAERIGIQIEYVNGHSWEELMAKFKRNEIDLMHSLVRTPEREAFGLFSDVVTESNIYFITNRSTGHVDAIEQLQGKTIAVVKGFSTEAFLEEYFPQVKLLRVANVEETLFAVAKENADATLLDKRVARYFINLKGIENIEISGWFKAYDQQINNALYYMVHKHSPELVGILNKALRTITVDDIHKLDQRWFGPEKKGASRAEIALTPEENKWLKQHPVIRVHNEKDWPPFNYFEFGHPRGLSIDYMNLLAAKLGIAVEYVTGPSWNDFLGMLKRQELDAMLNIVRTEDRLKYILFTEPYAKNPNTIVSAQAAPYETLEALYGKTVSFPAGFFIEEVLAKSYPQVKRLPVESTLESLKAVMFGQADAALAEAAVAQTLITDNLLAGLRLSGELDLGDPDLAKLRIGVRKDGPLLHAALMKAMAAVTPEEMNQIQRRWIADDFDAGMPPTPAPIAYDRLVAYGLGIFLSLCLLGWLLIRGLKREQIAVHFGSRWFRGMVIAGLSLFVLIVGLVGWFTLERNKAEILAAVAEDLTTTIKLGHDRLQLWVEHRTSAMRLLSRDPDLVVLTDRLLAVAPRRDDLLASSALRAMRQYFKTNKDLFANIGFFIINPDQISIGSMRDANVGTRNLIARQRPDLLRRAFAGEFLFVPPIESDVPLDKGDFGGGDRKPSTKFFMGPIRSPGGDVQAVMTLRVDPSEDLSQLLVSSQTRASGETYAFNDEGFMLSGSRFDSQLRRIGLLGDHQTSTLNLAIRDPGVNLLAGESGAVNPSQRPMTRMATHALASKNKMENAGQTYGHSRIEIDTNGYRDYRGVPVFGAWLWDNDLGFGLAAEIDAAEAMAAYVEIRRTVLGTLGFTLLLSVGAVLTVLILGERASRALLTARDDLEARVEARTAELQEKQEQLMEAEERARLLLDSAGEGIFGVDVDGRLAFINPAGCRMLGYEPDELIGEGIHSKVHYARPDGTPYPREECPMYHSFTAGTSSRITDEVLWRKDGTPLPVEYMSMPVHKDGRVVGAVVTFIDITERKHIEAELAAEKKGLQRILDSSPVAVGISVEGVIQYANEHLGEYLGIHEGEKALPIYVNPEDRDYVMQALENTDAVRNYELKTYNAKGEVRDMLSNYYKIEYEGQTAVLAWWTDITDIKATSEELKAKFDEMARFRRIAIGRELKMIELKKEINAFFKAKGAAEKYKIH